MGFITERSGAKNPAKSVIQFKGGQVNPPFKKKGGDRTDSRSHLPDLRSPLHIEQIDDPAPA